MKTSTRARFVKTMDENITRFGQNKLVEYLRDGSFTIDAYHQYLATIFHQVYNSATTFALAGVNCPESQWIARDYLIKHADEEKDHWQWIIDDLKNSGFRGEDPRSSFPGFHCQNYISFNYYVALKYPIARLGIAAVLEGIGATYAKANATLVCKKLNLKPEQAVFIFGHGDTDVGHTKEIIEVLDKSDLTPTDWGWLEFAASTAGELYRQMYDGVLK